MGCHLCSQGGAALSSWHRRPLPCSVPLTSASSGHWLLLQRQSHGWMLWGLVLCPLAGNSAWQHRPSRMMPVTFSSLTIALSCCSCPTPVHPVPERQELVPLPCHRCKHRQVAVAWGSVLWLGDSSDAWRCPPSRDAQQQGCTTGQNWGEGVPWGQSPCVPPLAAHPSVSQGPCPHHHHPAALPSTPLTCRPTRLLCSLMREWISL